MFDSCLYEHWSKMRPDEVTDNLDVCLKSRSGSSRNKLLSTVKQMNDSLSDVLASPKMLWTILTTEHKILGPWREHCGTNWSYGLNSFARFHYSYPRPCYKIWIGKSSRLRKHEQYEFHEWGGVDWEGLEKAIKEWEEEKLLWKEWEYRYCCHGDYEQHYTDSKEEAMKLADELAKSKGYLLYNGD